MKYMRFVVILVSLSVTGSAAAWNLGAKHVNALRFIENGSISFTLFDEGSSGDEFKCRAGSGGQWMTVAACPAGDANCLASTNRMASMLLGAKLAGKPVHVQRSVCAISEIALKP